MFSEMRQQILLEDDWVEEGHVEEEHAELLQEGQDQDPLQTKMIPTIQL